MLTKYRLFDEPRANRPVLGLSTDRARYSISRSRVATVVLSQQRQAAHDILSQLSSWNHRGLVKKTSTVLVRRVEIERSRARNNTSGSRLNEARAIQMLCLHL